MKTPDKKSNQRPLYKIAAEIKKEWKNVYFAAAPYLDAMATLNSIDDKYGCDDAKSIIIYFLSNAEYWRGDVARRIKKELKSIANIR